MVREAILAIDYVLPLTRCKSTPTSAAKAFGREAWEGGKGHAVRAGALQGVSDTVEKANRASAPALRCAEPGLNRRGTPENSGERSSPGPGEQLRHALMMPDGAIVVLVAVASSLVYGSPQK